MNNLKHNNTDSSFHNNSQNADSPQRQTRRLPWRWLGWSIPVCLLLLPLIAMQFTDEVDWSISDFIIMGTLMGTVGLGFELAFKLSTDVRYRVAAALALLSGFVLLWVNMAVGIVGHEGEDGNLLYFLVVLIGVVGAVATGFAPAGLARTLYMMVAALVLIALLLTIGSGAESPDPLHVMGITGFFVTLFLVPALLFQQLAREQAARHSHKHKVSDHD